MRLLTSGQVVLDDPITVGFIVADREGVVCDDSCEFAFDGVCDDGSESESYYYEVREPKNALVGLEFNFIVISIIVTTWMMTLVATTKNRMEKLTTITTWLMTAIKYV